MPLFEFVCSDCSKEFTFLSGVVAENDVPHCPRCGSQSLRKLVSRVARGRSDDERMDSLAERLEVQNLDDPGVVRRLAREMGRDIGAETGEDLGAALEEMIDGDGRSPLASGGAPSESSDDGTIY